MSQQRSKYVPPSQRIGVTNPTPQKQSLILSDANFPTLAPKYRIIIKPKDKSIDMSIPKLNFKQIAESAKDLPDPALVEPPLPTETMLLEDTKETYDLTAYVRLQEKRKREYDELYGEGSFVSDRLNYERFDSSSEHSDTSEEEGDVIDEDDLMDY
jgi:hypothetical protein